MLLLGGAAGSGRGSLVTGAVLSLVAALGFAVLALDRRPLPARSGRGAVTGWGFLAGGCFLLPAALNSGMAVPAEPETVAALIYLGLVPTALAYAAYFTALDRAAGSGVVAVLLEPLTATLLAGVLLREQMSPVQWGGAGCVLVAVLLQSRADTDQTSRRGVRSGHGSHERGHSSAGR